jgi:hypothetical protein
LKESDFEARPCREAPFSHVVRQLADHRVNTKQIEVCLNFLWFYPEYLSTVKFLQKDKYENTVSSIDDSIHG